MPTHTRPLPRPNGTITTLTLALAVLAAVPLAAQDPPPGDAGQAAGSAALQAGPPPGLAALELERSRACVPVLTRLDEVASELRPGQRRAERIRALHEAVTMEDSARAAPLDRDVPLERAVAEWFAADRELALRYLDTEDEAVREERRAARSEILERLEGALQEVSREARGILASAEGLQEEAPRCRDRILVRSAVLEACESASGPVCEAARAEGQQPTGPYRFAEEATDLWDVEQLRPWSEPSGLRPGPGGGLAGARTAALARRGNLSLVVSLEPRLQSRSALTEEEAAAFDAHLDSLGFDFDHPDFVMAPALRFELDAPGVLGGETHYVLHFGDFSEPEGNVIQSVAVPDAWPFAASFTANEATLVRMARGEAMAVTAVRAPGGEASRGEAVYSLAPTPIGQSSSVTALLRYMGGGGLSADLAGLVAPEGAGDGDGAPAGGGPEGPSGP